ncbi:hypothetical protein BaRGS_00023111 [Batillaria attramentaria]|uniref:Uncharacterized protein n=1 Tax=Batillaria attramentaria TaxID=370345 RepID=A0ABD0KFK1_9CAEN
MPPKKKPRVEKGRGCSFPFFAARVEEHRENSTEKEEDQATRMETSPRGEDASVEVGNDSVDRPTTKNLDNKKYFGNLEVGLSTILSLIVSVTHLSWWQIKID